MADSLQSSLEMKSALRWVEPLARVGYASKGAVHALIGAVAAGVAFGLGGNVTDSEGVFAILERKPLGVTLLMVIALGLLGYALWRYACALLDSDRRGSDAKGIALRAGFFVRATLYAMLAFEAFRIVRGEGSGGGDQQARHWAGRILAQPFGRFLLILAGLSLAAYGLYQAYRGFKGKLGSRVPTEALKGSKKRWLISVSRAGLLTRGVVFVLIAGFFLQAASHHDAGEAAGVAGALRTILAQPFGSFLLAVVAAGLIAYGILQFVKARYREVDAT